MKENAKRMMVTLARKQMDRLDALVSNGTFLNRGEGVRTALRLLFDFYEEEAEVII